MPTIAVVDDDRNILASLSVMLEAHNFRVETYTDGDSALSGLTSAPPDLALVDIGMPRMDGIAFLQRLRETSDLPVVLLTAREGVEAELAGLRHGADDYIRKPFSPRLLIERIRAVLRRAESKAVAVETTSTDVLDQGDLVLDRERHYCFWKGNRVDLTVTEFTILYLMAQRPGTIRERDVLMEAAYVDGALVDERTIDSHIKRIRRKMKSVDPDFDMIKTIYGVGYRFGIAA